MFANWRERFHPTDCKIGALGACSKYDGESIGVSYLPKGDLTRSLFETSKTANDKLDESASTCAGFKDSEARILFQLRVQKHFDVVTSPMLRKNQGIEVFCWSELGIEDKL